MSLTECVSFKLTPSEQDMGIDNAVIFYQQQIEEGSEEPDHFDRLAAIHRHHEEHDSEIHILLKAVVLYEKKVFKDNLSSCLSVLNHFTRLLHEARSREVD